MSYELEFIDKPLKEWNKLGSTVKEQFKKKLRERLELPKIESSRVSGMTGCYKIKLRQAGYRLIYQVQDERLVVLVLAVGKRERNSVYKSAIKHI
ncbi:MAG: type II toxin-antitoxin system RelE/ParE family toxin [Xanthomonadales bacterium]|nr:type II toxin-antitoxin system RelE/ParE family toxin [Xanthomonadales bacterium]